MITPLSTLKRWFSNFMKPTQEHFWAIFESFRHKSEKIPMEDIDGLTTALEGTASAEQLQNHLRDSHAHSGLFDRKVDKEAGKTLTSNDYTNEEKRTNQVNAQKRVVGLTVTGDVDKIITITFADGTAIQAPFTDNDTLPENLADIKLNSLNFNEQTGVLTGVRSDGQQLTVSLDGRYALLGHTHPEYALRTHTHSEYAPREHRHNWSEIDEKPAIITEEKIQEAIGRLQVGTRNFILKSRFETSKFANLLSGNATDYTDSIFGRVVRVLRPVDNGNFQYVFNLVPYNYSNKDLIFMLIAKPLTSGKFNFGKWDKTYSALSTVSESKALGDGWRLFWTKVNVPDIGEGAFGISSLQGDWLFYACGVFEGNTLVNWSPAPEDLLVSNNARARSSITLTHTHNNATIFLENITGVDMTGLEDLDSVSFRKCFATGHVNFFTSNGKQIVYTGDSRNMQEGGEGSTAVVSVYGNRIYVDIRNV
jgi:hypothetical protein